MTAMTNTIIKRSNIDNAGVGVFANKNIRKGEVITQYRGQSYKDNLTAFNVGELKLLKEDDIYYIINHTDYTYAINDETCYGYKFAELLKLYGKDAMRVCGSLINDTNNRQGSNINKEYNAEFGRLVRGMIGKQIIKPYNDDEIIALKNINKGDEIYINYGDNFWIGRMPEQQDSEQFRTHDYCNGKSYYEMIEHTYKTKGELIKFMIYVENCL